MGFREYGDYDAVGLAGLVRGGQVSPSELLDEALARTAALNPEINVKPAINRRATSIPNT